MQLKNPFFRSTPNFEVPQEFFKSTPNIGVSSEFFVNPIEHMDRLREFNKNNQNPKTGQFKKIADELLSIYIDKNHDYGDSFGDTFQKLGIISAVTRITDKTNRLISLSTKEARVNDESIEDTLMDLANYAIMMLIELRGESDE